MEYKENDSVNAEKWIYLKRMKWCDNTLWAWVCVCLCTTSQTLQPSVLLVSRLNERMIIYSCFFSLSPPLSLSQYHHITFSHYHTNSLYIISMQLDIVYAIFFPSAAFFSSKRAMNVKVARQKVSRLFARLTFRIWNDNLKCWQISSHFINTQILFREWIFF